MKKFLSLMIVSAGILFAAEASAQIKIGYIKMDDMVGIMPETARIDSLLERYQADSSNPQYLEIDSINQYKYSIYRDTLKTRASVIKQIEQKLPTLIYQIQNWKQIFNQALEAKQNELLATV